jgi:hypothetical protein
MIIYDFNHICDGCDLEKMTRKVDHLDIRHRNLEHFLCRKCDISNSVYKKIHDKNTKLYGLGDAFGLMEGVRKFIIINDKS